MGITENLKLTNRILVDREVVLREIRSVMAIFNLDHRSAIMSILLNKQPLISGRYVVFTTVWSDAIN